MKKIRVLIGGASPFLGSMLVEQINNLNQGVETKTECVTRSNVIAHLANVDILHGIYMGTSPVTLFIAKLLRKKTICHWIGTDVFTALTSKKERLKAKLSDRFVNIHLAVSPGLVDELKSIGIDALWMPIVPPIVSDEIRPLPGSFTALSYIPDARSDFYGASIIHQLAKDFPTTNFIIVSGEGKGVASLPNVTYLGWQEDMDKIYEGTNVLLRITKHDGLSKMVLEALARGRQVIWSQPFPYCYYARDFTEAKAALSSMQENPVINHDGIRYIKDEFNSSKIIERLVEIYTSLC